MDLSVVVATLNGRDALVDSLDALVAAAPSAELIVANGPSTDGTSGMVRDRDDVAVLLELAERNVNVARNAGAAVASGEIVAFVDERTAVVDGWWEGVMDGLDGAGVVTGPVRWPLSVGSETSRPEHDEVAGRRVSFFDGANVAFRRDALAAIDGFDEYLDVGGARDAAHRLAGIGIDVGWSPEVLARRQTEETDRDARSGGTIRCLAYRLAKNYGPRPGVASCLLGSAHRDGLSTFRDAARGDISASRWLGDANEVIGGGVRGAIDGLTARVRDRRPARNPAGISARDDRVVRQYDLA